MSAPSSLSIFVFGKPFNESFFAGSPRVLSRSRRSRQFKSLFTNLLAHGGSRLWVGPKLRRRGVYSPVSDFRPRQRRGTWPFGASWRARTPLSPRFLLMFLIQKRLDFFRAVRTVVVTQRPP
jgi:hypothetical protein